MSLIVYVLIFNEIKSFSDKLTISTFYYNKILHYLKIFVKPFLFLLDYVIEQIYKNK